MHSGLAPSGNAVEEYLRIGPEKVCPCLTKRQLKICKNRRLRKLRQRPVIRFYHGPQAPKLTTRPGHKNSQKCLKKNDLDTPYYDDVAFQQKAFTCFYIRFCPRRWLMQLPCPRRTKSSKTTPFGKIAEKLVNCTQAQLKR